MTQSIEVKRFVFNVGGTKFMTTPTTIERSEYLKTLVSGKFSPPDEDGSYFIDRNPKLFEQVLEFLRNPGSQIKSKYKKELDFYCIDYTENDVYDHKETYRMKLSDNINSLNDKLDMLIKLEKENNNNNKINKINETDKINALITKEKHVMEKREKGLCLYPGCINKGYEMGNKIQVWCCIQHKQDDIA